MMVTKQEAATLLDMSVPLMENKERAFSPIPSVMDGKRRMISVKALLKWEISRRLSEVVGSDGEGLHDFTIEKARLTFHQANKTELESKKMRGELVLADDVEQRYLTMVQAFKKSLLNLPNRIINDVLIAKDDIEIKEILNKEIKESLDELSQD